MQIWLIQNWWWVFPVLGIAIYVTVRVRRRGGDEPLLLRIYYAVDPDSDPQRKPHAKISRLGVVMIVIIVAVITAMNFVPWLND